mmetsp:Transcript_12001/g.28118  ORF Transcript_12001/g.28118 Transcript_12001/m.28118 type:complete len:305 (+) Transcript_12001:191-1105(+)
MATRKRALVRGSSKHFRPEDVEPVPLRLLDFPLLPRTVKLQRNWEVEHDWTGAPKTPLGRKDSEREVEALRANSFHTYGAASPLQLGWAPPSVAQLHAPYSPLHAMAASGRGWLSSSAPAASGAPRAHFTACPSPTHHGMLAHLGTTRRFDPKLDATGSEYVFPKIRTAGRHTPFHMTSPLCRAKDLEHKMEIMEEHGMKKEAAAADMNDDENESHQKLVLLRLKPHILDGYATANWDLEHPLRSWRRVKTTKDGQFVEGLSLVSTQMEGEIRDIAAILREFKHIKSLLMHNNPRVTGNIRHLR